MASEVDDAPLRFCTQPVIWELDAVNHIPHIDVKRVSSAYETRVRAVLGDYPDVLRLRDRLDPERWKLEWNLPAWLGGCFGLDARLSADICVSNVLGLASIRLRDDVADAEVATTESPASAERMSDALYDAALDVYRGQFDPSSEFWGELAVRMGQWRTATVAASVVEPDQGLASQGTAPRDLAMRGAPLKISAFAVCLLTGHREDFAVIDRCLDHALTAMVLYDSLIDWREDLAASRPNPFVAAARGRALGHVRASSTGADVDIAMLMTDAIPAHFGLIVDELTSAATLASSLGVDALVGHLTHLATNLDQQGAELTTRYQGLAEKAQLLMFGNRPRLAA